MSNSQGTDSPIREGAEDEARRAGIEKGADRDAEPDSEGADNCHQLVRARILM